jgi:hypothetical protein
MSGFEHEHMEGTEMGDQSGAQEADRDRTDGEWGMTIRQGGVCCVCSRVPSLRSPDDGAGFPAGRMEILLIHSQPNH